MKTCVNVGGGLYYFVRSLPRRNENVPDGYEFSSAETLSEAYLEGMKTIGKIF